MKQHSALGISERLRRLFYEPTTPGFYLVNDVLAVATIVSVLGLILETVPSLSHFSPVFATIEFVAVALFSTEYIARIIANKKRVRTYTLSFFGIIDLLAILPSFLGLSNFTFLKTARTLRILRLLRMARLAKLAQNPRRRAVGDTIQKSANRLSAEIYFATLLTAVTISGTLVFVVEGGAYFSSIPRGMLWALKVTMGSTPVHMPVSFMGEVVTIMTYFFGLLLFGLLVSVMGNALNKLLLGERET